VQYTMPKVVTVRTATNRTRTGQPPLLPSPPMPTSRYGITSSRVGTLASPRTRARSTRCRPSLMSTGP
jgi:hypothetical protein